MVENVASGESDVDLPALLAGQRIQSFHIGLIALCALACFPSGFNVFALGYLAPTLTAALALPLGGLTPVFIAYGVGNVLGTVVCGLLADHIGRKAVIVGALVFSVPFILATAFVHTLGALIVTQVLSGIGLMGLLGVALTLASEYMPTKNKLTLTIIVWTGFLLGSSAAGPLITTISTAFGWHTVYIASAVLVLGVAVLLALTLPESLTSLVHRGRGSSSLIAAVLKRIDPTVALPEHPRFTLDEGVASGFSIALLFRQGRSLMTIVLWVMFLTNFMAIYFVMSWLPTLLASTGMTQGVANAVASAAGWGAIPGGIAIALLADTKQSRFVVLACCYLIGAVAVATIGIVGNHLFVAMLVVLLVGFFTFGVQTTTNAVTSTLYPTAIRSTGVGMALGLGQTAQIWAAFLGGSLIAHNWPTRSILEVAAGFPAVAALASVVLWKLTAAQRASTTHYLIKGVVS
jgi:AAHS family 4-hydroxybenzoate transporter-like MFS transporter